jgi:hypothetical protein
MSDDAFARVIVEWMKDIGFLRTWIVISSSHLIHLFVGFDPYGLKTMEVKFKQASLLQNQI